MTLRDLINEHAGSVFLNADHFAEGITHYPGGSAPSATITAAFFPEEKEDRDEERGDGYEIYARLEVADSVTITRKDKFTIGGRDWYVVSIGVAELGLLPIRIVNREQLRTTGNGRPRRHR
ncbi:hypothetical protein KOR42_39400 [Thalassoglobus neptunius]|uniref:Phage head-tail joining protein n=1 Tax=Thalassoglobus neptunius TaxID=1938619 RepID=A0A5C5WE66_9PLAN|nr:hypothetical protein [Thalassoglobus neptunius]TWT49024.1 hypothetical protein KOR42_39400 [Thalassoglobus neptunius]